jgi:hypothetical protein
MSGGSQCRFYRVQNRLSGSVRSAGEWIGDLESKQLPVRLADLGAIKHDHFTRPFGGVQRGHSCVKTGETFGIRPDRATPRDLV